MEKLTQEKTNFLITVVDRLASQVKEQGAKCQQLESRVTELENSIVCKSPRERDVSARFDK